MTHPNRVPQPVAIWRDLETPWHLTGSDDEVIFISRIPGIPYEEFDESRPSIKLDPDTSSFTYAANEETNPQLLVNAQVLAAAYRTGVEDYVLMLSKRICDASMLITDNNGGVSAPAQAIVNSLDNLVQKSMRWLEDLAEIEIKSKQRLFELRIQGTMTDRETMKFKNIRADQESWNRKRKALLACAATGTGPRVIYVDAQFSDSKMDNFV
ncbi:MAG: hypothetical protein Q9168_000142 [Polycauliona sp. 1 TL-2023]